MKKLGLRKKSRIFSGRTGKGLPQLRTLRMMKKCSKCGEENPATPEVFSRQEAAIDGFHAWCKECCSAYSSVRFQTLSEQESFRERKAEEKRVRGRKYKKLLIEHFGGKCVTCGYDRCPAGFDFHHIIPEEKEFSIGQSCGNFAYERLLKEAEKCMLLCSNCHRELHYNESEESSEVDRDSETTLPDLLCEESEVSDVPLCLSVEEESSDFNWAEQS